MERLPVVPPARALLLGLLATAVLAALGAAALGEEAFVLDNGSVLRGTVLRQDGDALEIRLSGQGMRGIVTVERSRIVQRFVTIDPNGPVGARAPAPEAAAARIPPTAPPAAPRPATPPAATTAAPAPAADPGPSLAEEGFFQRFVRRASNALPAGAGARAFLVGLALAVMTALVALGARMAEIEDATLGRCAVVAFVLGGLVALATGSAGAVLRSDAALLVLPAGLLAWAGLAAAVFRCGFGRAFTLLAFVLLAGALVLFTTGVVVTAV